MLKNLLISLAFAGGMFGASTAAIADGLSIGRVAYFYVSHNSNGFALVRLHGSQAGTQPACASNTNVYAFALDDFGGFAYLSVIQNAIANNRELRITGAGQCTVSGSREDIESIESSTP